MKCVGFQKVISVCVKDGSNNIYIYIYMYTDSLVIRCKRIDEKRTDGFYYVDCRWILK